jgi:polyhydroxybutyrate depolymerase
VGLPLAAGRRALKTRPGSRARAALAALAVVVGGCRRDRTPPRVFPADAASTALPLVVRPEPAPGTTRTTGRSIDLRGRQRGYLLVEPAEREEGRRYPLVLVFHGDGGDAAGFHQAWPFERASGKDAVLAYLDGMDRRWDLEATIDNRDVTFVEAVIADVERTHAIDRARVFATGYSSGGFLANVVACHRPGLLRAIASSAGGAPYNQLLRWPNGYPMCPGQKPIAMLALHGEHDLTVTLDSGRFSAEYWAYVNDCNTHEMESTGYAQCRFYRGCPAGRAVGFCSIPSLGHWVWSEAAFAAWTFFERQ